MTPHDRLTATIKKRLPRLQDWEVADVVKDIEEAGLLAGEWVSVNLVRNVRGPFEAIDSRGVVGFVVNEDGDGWDSWSIDLDDIVAVRQLPQPPKAQNKGVEV